MNKRFNVAALPFHILYKLYYRLKRLQQQGLKNVASVQQYKSVLKKWKRKLKQFTSARHPLYKALGLAILSIALSADTNAQCNQYQLNEANPLNGPLCNLYEYSETNTAKFTDVDGDGDYDAYQVRRDGPGNFTFIRFVNIGTPSYPVYNDDTSAAVTGFNKNDFTGIYNIKQMEFADLDGDGDDDCFMITRVLDAEDVPVISYYKNTDTGGVPHFEKNDAENPFGNIFYNPDPFQDQNFYLADFDDDGDTDLLMYEYYGQYIHRYDNVGDATHPEYELASNPFGYFFYNPSFYDWDKDGLTDMFLGNWDDVYFKNVGSVGNPQYEQTSVNAPVLIDNYIDAWTDLNNDGFPEIFNYGYNTASPVATIQRSAIKKIDNIVVAVLQAYPKDDAYTYQWKRNGVNIVRGTKDSLYATQQGKYTVEIITPCGTSLSAVHMLRQPSAAIAGIGVKEAATASVQVKTWPNPFTSQVSIQLPQLYKGSTVKIINAQGQTVSTQTVMHNKLSTGSKLAPGIYFLQVIQQGKLVYTEKIIKQ